jgi:uncharacterized membrane protein required for colicin V production
MEELRTLDAIVGVLLVLATLRGVWIGAVGEVFSLAGLAAAAYVVRTWRLPAGAWLATHSPIEMTELAARVLAALGLGLATLLAVALLRQLVRRGVRGAGLALADRVAGALLGAVEGALVAAALVFGLAALLGRDDEALVGTRSLAAFEWAEAAAGVEAGGARAESDRPTARGEP